MGRAIYQTQTYNIVAITDLGLEGAISVTNAIESVLKSLVEAGRLIPGHPYQRVIYRDSDGHWDRVDIDEQCRFVRFAPIARSWKHEPMLDTDPRLPMISMLADDRLGDLWDGADAH
jgi:hypothetical protein